MPTLCLLEVTQVLNYAPKRSTADERNFQIKWKTSHFILSRRSASRNFRQILHGDRSGPCHHFMLQTFLDLVHSFAAKGRRKFGWKRPHRGKLLIILSFIELKQPYLAQLCRLRTRIKRKFCKNRARDSPLRGKYIGKIPFFQFWRP